MKILIILNTDKWKEHLGVGNLFQKAFLSKGYEAKQLDLRAIRWGHEKKEMIISEKPNLLVTFDMAGFEMRTLSEKATYNVIPCRMAHILLREMEEYNEEWLKDDMNFSMFFYASEQTSRQIVLKYPEIEHVTALETCSVSEWTQNHALIDQIVDTIICDTEIEIDY